MVNKRDHGGGLDAAILSYGGQRSTWIDLSTGINPVPYGIPEIAADGWTTLPDRAAADALIEAARQFWHVPHSASIIAAPGASCLIANMPYLSAAKTVHIHGPTYNEHAAAFVAAGQTVSQDGTRAETCDAQVVVHPNNPDGKLWNAGGITAPFKIIDESFCDVCPDASLVQRTTEPNTIVLKSFGKFWGLAGLRLGFAIGQPDLIATLADRLGPWPVSGPALQIGTAALRDKNWAAQTRTRLGQDTQRLDALMQAKGAKPLGGTTLFRLYDVGDAQAYQDKLAQAHIWSRIFPYSDRWLRLGLPHPTQWDRLEAAL